jgi:c-di-GMP-binding flagellar brake protein YcgR
MSDGNISRERRVYPRIPLKVAVNYRVVEDQKEITTVLERNRNKQITQTINMSLGGLCFISREAIGVGSIVRLEIALPDIPHMISAYAEVVWSNGSFGGLHFEAMKEGDVDALKDYLSRTHPEN